MGGGATGLAHQCELSGGFGALGGGLDAEIAAQYGDGAYSRRVVAESADEAAVDLVVEICANSQAMSG